MLKKGPDSPYYGFFDIMAGQPESRNTPGAIPGERLMAPFLGADLSDCPEKGEFSLQHTARGFVIRYYDKDYPVTPQLYRICTGSESPAETGTPPHGWLSALHDLESSIAALF